MFEKELDVAKQAVIEGMRICRTIQKELTGGESITKSDKSPVTIADFASQAIVCEVLNRNFPGIPIVGEESSDALKEPGNKDVLEKIYHYIENDAAINRLVTRENLFACIDLGGSEPNPELFWTLDPIDGTKGFLREEQFAVALALIVEGDVKVGLLGCPNLERPGKTADQGYLIYAVKDGQTVCMNVSDGSEETVSVSEVTDPEEMRFVESYVSAHSNTGMQLEIARRLKMKHEPVRMDSQVKYAVLALGDAEIYLRIPHPKTPHYKEKIWDHAAGKLVVETAGGTVTDVDGKPLDFRTGKTLKDNRGIAASVPSVHDRIMEIVRQLS